jgi:hypothetical protein
MRKMEINQGKTDVGTMLALIEAVGLPTDPLRWPAGSLTRIGWVVALPLTTLHRQCVIDTSGTPIFYALWPILGIMKSRH